MKVWDLKVELNATPTISPHVAFHNLECRKQKQLDLFYSDSGSDWGSPKFFDLSTTKIACYISDKQQLIFAEPSEDQELR